MNRPSFVATNLSSTRVSLEPALSPLSISLGVYAGCLVLRAGERRFTMSREHDNTTACGDDFFGPSVWSHGCRGGFDFTLAFEESILTILPAAVFLVVFVPRAVYLVRAKSQAKRQISYSCKLVASILLAVFQIASLALLASTRKIPKTSFSIASAVLNVLASLAVIFLAHIEHVKSLRPSFILSAYLFASLLFDAAHLRTEWLLAVHIPYAAILSVSTTLKLVLLVLESVEKRSILLDQHRKPSKESTSGPFNQGLLIWLNSLLTSGWATILTNKDLPKIYEGLSSERLAEKFSVEWERATAGGKKPSLFRTIVNILKWDLISIALPRFAAVGFVIAQPFLISNALRFLSMPDNQYSTNLGYGLIGAFALVFIGLAVATAWYEYLSFRAAAMVRGGLIMLVYRKMVRLPIDGLAESSALTLMGNDIETMVERIPQLLVETWANAITVLLAVYLLERQLGAVCVAPIVTALISLGLSTYVGKKVVGRQTSYQKVTQERINFTSEVLGSLKSVRMLGYADKFSKFIEQKRDADLKGGVHYRWLIICSNTIANVNITVTQAATFGAYAIAAKVSGSQTFSAAQAITALSILVLLTIPLATLLGSIGSSMSAIGCIRRVQEFLLLDERLDSRKVSLCETFSEKEAGATDSSSTNSVELQELTIRPKTTTSHHGISITNGKFKWKDAVILNDINTSFASNPKGSLTMIIGPVGCGKSSLVKAILGEMSTVDGVISMPTANIAFCDQTSWIMNASIHDNIVAESEVFDTAWFDTVVEACDLTIDFSRLSEGIQTVVGSKGLKLSGGQRQRLAMARAIYARKPVAIFDDVFSGLDKVTEQAVFTRVFGENGLLRRNGTMTILITHAVKRLPESDHVIALDEHGTIAEQGTFSNLQLGGKYMESLDISNMKQADENHDNNDDDGDEDGDDEDKGEYENDEKSQSSPKLASESAKPQGNVNGTQDEQQRSSDMATFKYYFAAVGPGTLAVGFLYDVLFAFSLVFRGVWVTWWGDGRGQPSSNVGYWLGIYATMSVVEALLVGMTIFHFVILVGPRSGKKLHSRILRAAMNATTSFLSSTETGSLVNRFSQDIRLIDIVMPFALCVFLLEVTSVAGVIGIAVAAVKWVAIGLPFIAGVLVIIQRFYVKTSKQLRILEIEEKAPLYAHFLESIQGLVTIRAFGWTHPYVQKSVTLIDSAQKPAYLLHCLQRWLTLALDLVVAAITILLIVFAVTLRNKVSPSLLGVALVNMMNLGQYLKTLVIHWSTLETTLGAVTRIKDFEEKTPAETATDHAKEMSQDWPASGNLEIKNIAMQYDSNARLILDDVSLSIKHGEKIGLCGRTGSGKSSVVQALLRMTDISKGEILLDGQSILEAPRSLIRGRLNCLTQEPFLFTNTVRFNADPLTESSDQDVIRSLQRVGLWEIIQSKAEPGNDPLQEKMSENFLSHGQRQLFCLARALMKKSPVLILDEPTSSVDNKTDAKIQEVIRSEFQDSTIIMIAHRISTLLDFDKVAVLEDGRVAEFGPPSELLKNGSGLFVKLFRADRKTKGQRQLRGK